MSEKTAERIILELKDKFQDFTDAAVKSGVEADVMSALENLGFSRGICRCALSGRSIGDRDPVFDLLFKRALQILTKG